jgi:hypothetical protein
MTSSSAATTTAATVLNQSLIDSADELAALDQASPGSADFVLGMIKVDMEWQQARINLEDARQYKVRLLTIWLTLGIVVVLAGMATIVTLAGQPWVGGILAGVDLVALATVFMNAGRRA